MHRLNLRRRSRQKPPQTALAARLVAYRLEAARAAVERFLRDARTYDRMTVAALRALLANELDQATQCLRTHESHLAPADRARFRAMLAMLQEAAQR